MEEDQYKILIEELAKTLKIKAANVSNVIELITLGMEIVEKFPDLKGEDRSKILINALDEVAKGKDGLVGTDDDVIPANILEPLKTIMSLGIVQDIIAQIIRATKGKLTINNMISLGRYMWNFIVSLKDKCVCSQSAK